MPFHPPSWSPQLPHVPDSISLERFMFDEQYGRHALNSSLPPFVDGLSGRSYSALEMKERVEHLARALSKELGFDPHKGSEWDKVIGCFSLNTVDYLTLAWAVHRLGGILSCVSAAYGPSELEYQMSHSGCKAIFTCLPLLDTCNKGIEKAKIPKDKIYLLPLADQVTEGMKNPGHKTLEDLVQAGKKLPKQEASDERWSKGEGARRTAFLCYSSGTSGWPKGVMIPHMSVIANTLQMVTHETPGREAAKKKNGSRDYTENCLGLLPMSHIYGLVVISHVGPYRGDGVIVLPKYDFKALLKVIEYYKIAMLYLVPPMIIHLTNARDEVKQHDLSSVRECFTGAAPLGEETADGLLKLFPDWALKQGYGLTETSTVVCATAAFDIWLGSSGSLLPGYTARIITPEGEEIDEYGKPGELCVKSPSLVLGYLNNEKATNETFVQLDDGRYMKTGDEAMIKKSPKGHEHVFITDRIKEGVSPNPTTSPMTQLIKVKGNQVAPAELESHLLAHEAVSDCVVIGVPSEREGEVPKAFVVKDASATGSDDEVKKAIVKHVEDHKTNYKWLRGGVELIDVVPKSASGKILRRLIRDQEKEKMKKQGPKL